MANREYALWGSAGHAMVLRDIIESQGHQVVMLFDNKPNQVPAIAGVQCAYGESGFREWRSKIGESGIRPFGLVAIGGHHGEARIRYHNLFKEAGLIVAPLIAREASVSPNTKVGDGTQILPNVVVGSGACIGEACILNHGSQADHECEISEGVHIAPRAALCGCVRVGARSMIGAGTTVLPRLKIGAGSIVGAGSVVTKDIPDGVIAYGNPARIIRRYDA